MLPGIFPPAILPSFLAAGHGIEEVDPFVTIPNATGHSRRRMRFTTTERIVSVGWLLDQAQITALDEWFENVLLAGQRHFTAKVAKEGFEQEYWDAVWVQPYTAEAINGAKGVLWRVTGLLLLSGEPSDTRPADGELLIEFLVSLDGSGQVSASGALAVEFIVSLDPNAPLSVEFEVSLEVYEPHFLLIGDGFRLLLDGTHHLKIE